MTISSTLLASSNAIGTIIDQARDPWWIIASAAVALHGADPGGVADVDILLRAADARVILPAIGIELRIGSVHAVFRSSIFGT